MYCVICDREFDDSLRDCPHCEDSSSKLSGASEGLKIGPFGFVDNYNLECGSDGVIRVKDGRTLNEYINSPSMVKARKDGKTNHDDWILITATSYERGCIPHCS